MIVFLLYHFNPSSSELSTFKFSFLVTVFFFMVVVKELSKYNNVFSLVIVRKNKVMIVSRGRVRRCGSLVVSAWDSRSIISAGWVWTHAEGTVLYSLTKALGAVLVLLYVKVGDNCCFLKVVDHVFSFLGLTWNTTVTCFRLSVRINAAWWRATSGVW